MRRVRFLISVVFLASCLVCAVYIIKTKLVEDNTPPVISCEEDTVTVSIEDDESALLKGVKAKDNRDGDITDSVRVSSMSHFVNGKRTVTYVVFDKANHVGTLERTVKYSDYKPPRIHLKKPLRFLTTASSELDFTDCYTAEDCLDGDITNQVRTIVDNNFYGMQEGVFDVTLQVSNSAGDVCSVPVEMQITYTDDEDEKAKEYPLLSDYIVYTSVGKKINASKYLTGISRNGVDYEFGDMITASADDISIKSEVDYSKPGVYTVNYSYKASGAPKAVTKLYVVVEGEERGEE